ncbi:MAG: exopolysaccharide biosynthesis polyprenyl glycosylphosphotransferase, partial [Eubacteriales bacterium]|nr:exopolysaccharide biosynthesis polyprenyl glycosylphosphotransferase [Eubacteriales bacterium]
MDKRYVLSQVVKTVFQCLLYLSLFLTFFLLLSITNPQIINMSRTAATTMATFAIVLAILTYVYGGYQLGIRKSRSVFASIVIAIVLTDIATYLQLQIMNVNPANNDRLILFGEDLWLLMTALLIQIGLIYFFVMLGYRFYFTINPPERCCVIASSQEQAEHIAEKIATFRQKYRLGDVLHYECEDVEETILKNDVVFLAGIPDTEEEQLKSFCYQNGKTIYLQAELGDVIVSTSQQNVIDDTLFLYISREEPTLLQRFIKRLSDIMLSFLGLIVTSPMMLIATLMIFLSHNGPIFFRQKRATIGGKVFEIIKFRTMYCDACDATGQSACENDERVTKVGKILRKYRIDELPQLFNVLSGDMSIVGPRPEMLENVDRYTQEVPEFVYRQQMKAGLTGMAQIDGKYNTTPKDKVILDLFYIENFSLMLDMKMIFRTVTVF